MTQSELTVVRSQNKIYEIPFAKSFLICAFNANAQTYLDQKIIVTVNDTTGIYQKVRIAFGKNDFQVKEDG